MCGGQWHTLGVGWGGGEGDQWSALYDLFSKLSTSVNISSCWPTVLHCSLRMGTRRRHVILLWMASS